MLFNTFMHLAILAPFALGESLEAYRHIKRSALQTRQNCQPGAVTCSQNALFRYCANPGYKCCDADNVAPETATCCPGGSYAPLGSYCCSNGRYCTNGRTCLGCTAVSGTGPVSVPSFSVPAVPSTTRAPVLPTSTRVIVQNTYYTFTVTYYYFQYYYIYVQALSRSTPTSSTVTTTTTVSVFAANSAEARSSFNDLSATLALPTPASATFLPPLPSQTSSSVEPVNTGLRAGGPDAPQTSQPPQNTNGAGRVGREGGWYGVFVGGVFGLVML